MTLFRWSRTAANNATADITAPFPEGMGAPALNDGARGIMAAVAKHRDDMAGAIFTAGTAGAYTMSSFQGFGSLTDLHQQEIAFSPHTTNVDTVTLSVDGLAAKPLRSAPNTEILAGTLVQGTPYIALYNNTDGAFYLKAFYSSPFNVPFLGGLDYWDTITPNSGFIFPAGQAISRTVFARAFARWGTQFGAGNGTTTFNVPDKAGRVSAMVDAAGARLTGGFFPNAGTIGTVGGSDNHTLTAIQIPTISSANPANPITVGISSGFVLRSGSSAIFDFSNAGGSGLRAPDNTASMSSSQTFNGNNAISVTSNNTGGGAHNNVPPTIVCNYIIRVI